MIKVPRNDRIIAAKIYTQIIVTEDNSHFYQLRKLGKMSELLLDFTHAFENPVEDIEVLNSICDQFLCFLLFHPTPGNDGLFLSQMIFNQLAENSLTQKLIKLNNREEMTLCLLREYISKYPDAFDHDLKLIQSMRKVKKFSPYNQYTVLDLSPLNRVHQEFDEKLLDACENLINSIQSGQDSSNEIRCVHNLLCNNILRFKNSPESMNFQLKETLSHTKSRFLNELRQLILRKETNTIENLPVFLITLSVAEFHILLGWIDQLAILENYDELILAVFEMHLEHENSKFRSDLNLLRWMINNGTEIINTTYCNHVDNLETAHLWVEAITQPSIAILKKLSDKLGKNVLKFKETPVCFTKPTSIYNFSDPKSYTKFVQAPSQSKQSTKQGGKTLLDETIVRSKFDYDVEMWRPLLDNLSFEELFEKFDVLVAADPNFSRLDRVIEVFANHGIIVHGKSESETIAIFAQDLRAMAKICFNSSEAKKYLEGVSCETKITYTEELDTFRSIYLGDSNIDWTSGTIYSVIETFIEGIVPRSIDRYIPEKCDIKQVVLDLTKVLN